MAKKFDSKGAARGMARERTLTILVPIISVLLALVVGGIVIACLGKNPIQGYALLFSGSLGTPQKFASSLVSACPLIFTALAAAFAYRCGVFNLGGEGQFIMGAVSAIVFLLVTGIEGIAGTVLAILVGTVVGALWAALPGIMKITRGLNEMITSIMLNYVATLFMGFIYTNAFRDGGNPQTPSVADSVMLAKIPGFRIHTGVILAIVLGLVVAYVISKTSFGFKIRAVGLNPLASKVNGFNVKFLVVAAFVISGAIAGMGGAVELLGKQYRLMSGFGSGFGFDGVAIALIAQLNPLASLLVAIFFGALTTGASSMQVGIMVPTAIVEIIRALIIIFSVAGVALIKLPKIQALIQQMGSGKAKKEEVNA
ncbi:ABC transporter permease [Paratractidigestivibacter faecalis]|uniref:ABC transporter permease n=1 Tax=Paratractidigestivibacter faecalis TaxID=2292441 RepID=UPI003A9407E2